MCSILEMAKMFPALPRTGQVVDPGPSSFSPISFRHSQPEVPFPFKKFKLSS